MDSAELRAAKAPPKDKGAPLAALWHSARGEWDKAHALIQDDETAAAAWVHAHLHRVEGDAANARYWYSRAGKAETKTTIEEEWKIIANALLSDYSR